MSDWWLCSSARGPERQACWYKPVRRRRAHDNRTHRRSDHGFRVRVVPLDIDLEANGLNNLSVTQREPEARETWRALDAAGVEAFKKSPVSQWAFGGGELVRDAFGVIKVGSRGHLRSRNRLTHLIQYGLYDRPELGTWHFGRVVLIGDAAHPTSPVCIPPSL